MKRWLMTVAMTAAALPCWAHVFPYPKEDAVRVGRGAVEVILRYHVSPGREAQSLREIHDRNGDGALSADEQSALASFFGRETARFFEIRINGTPRPAAFDPARLDGAGPRADDASEIHALITGRIPEPPWKKGVNTIEIRDRDRDRTKQVPLTLTWDESVKLKGDRPERGIAGFLRPGEPVRVEFRLK